MSLNAYYVLPLGSPRIARPRGVTNMVLLPEGGDFYESQDALVQAVQDNPAIISTRGLVAVDAEAFKKATPAFTINNITLLVLLTNQAEVMNWDDLDNLPV